MVISTRITSKFQITLPKKVREALEAKIGDRLIFVPLDKTAWKIQATPEQFTEALTRAKRHLSPADFRKIHAEFEESTDDAHR